MSDSVFVLLLRKKFVSVSYLRLQMCYSRCDCCTNEDFWSSWVSSLKVSPYFLLLIDGPGLERAKANDRVIS